MSLEWTLYSYHQQHLMQLTQSFMAYIGSESKVLALQIELQLNTDTDILYPTGVQNYNGMMCRILKI